MKRETEEERLLSDILANAAPLRHSTLEAGLTALRRKRRLRTTLRFAGCVLVPVVALALWIARSDSRSRDLEQHAHFLNSAVSTNVIEGTSIRVLSDEELLAFFQGRPLALIGSAGQQELLLFDEPRN